MKRTHNILLLLMLAVLLGACSTTSKLGENDILYTGVKYLKYHPNADSVRIEDAVKDNIFQAINVKPNNPLYSPYVRSPLPIGLWVYNHMDPDAKGFKGWIYKMLVAKPVLIRRVNPEARVEMINELLRNNGYFTSSARYQLIKGKNPKKARIAYDVDVAAPYTLGEIAYLEEPTEVGRIIDSVARRQPYLRTGSRYCLDSLNNVRINIANALRNQGYYYYSPEYIRYLADSVNDPGVVHLQLIEADDVPNQAHMQYYTHEVTATVHNPDRDGVADTVAMPRCTIVRYDPVRVKNSLIADNLRARPGRPFRVNSMDRTQLLLSRTGIFGSIDMQVLPVDSITPDGHGLLDLQVNTVLDAPWEVKLEMQATSKSNSYIGPGLELGLSHKNVFGGGERWNIKLTGAYEWQTGNAGGYKSSNYNSYQFGIETSLAFPRLLAPRFVDRSRRFLNWTRIELSANILNRPHLFKMLQLGASFTWEWHATRHSLNEFTPFSLIYSKVLSATDEFYEALAKNITLAASFMNQFIPALRYSYTYDNDFGPHHINWRTTLTESGNVFAGIWSLCGSKGKKHMLGTPFSQFIKGETQLVWTRHFGPRSALVSRLFIGAGYAYGNSTSMPFREMFYTGGANSVRAFAVRSIGPGSFTPNYAEVDKKYYYYSMVGDMKFEANCEYRFPLFGNFNGALFLDAGNVWLVQDYETIEEGRFMLKNFLKDLALGTGLGLRFDMGMLVLRADLGIALHCPYNTGKSGYFNIARFKDSFAFHLAIGYPF